MRDRGARHGSGRSGRTSARCDGGHQARGPHLGRSEPTSRVAAWAEKGDGFDRRYSRCG